MCLYKSRRRRCPSPILVKTTTSGGKESLFHDGQAARSARTNHIGLSSAKEEAAEAKVASALIQIASSSFPPVPAQALAAALAKELAAAGGEKRGKLWREWHYLLKRPCRRCAGPEAHFVAFCALTAAAAAAATATAASPAGTRRTSEAGHWGPLLSEATNGEHRAREEKTAPKELSAARRALGPDWLVQQGFKMRARMGIIIAAPEAPLGSTFLKQS